jgi:hypothetical protein
MGKLFEELAYSETQMGELTLRRRRLAGQDTDVFEIKRRRRIPDVEPVHRQRDGARRSGIECAALRMNFRSETRCSNDDASCSRILPRRAEAQ